MTHQDEFQIWVEDCAKIISDEIYSNNKELVIVHFVAGPEEFPYEIRRSNIILKNTILNEIYREYNPAANKADENYYHNKVLKNYIQYYARHHTYLTLVAKTYAKIREEKPDLSYMLFQFLLSKKTNEPIYDVDDKSPNKYMWNINKKEFNILIPSNLAIEFWRYFYTLTKDDDIYSVLALEWMARIDFLRTLTSLKRIQKKTNENNLLDVIKYGLEKEDVDGQILYRKEYSLITAFQSMGIFMRGLKKQSEDIIGTTAIVKTIHSEKNKHLALVVVMISPADNSKEKEIRDQIDKSFKAYNEYITTLQEDTAMLSIVSKEILPAIDKDYLKKKEDYEDTVGSIFSSRIQKIYASTYCTWILLLINKLSDKVHEGKKLNFYLICGDRSEFEDNTNIEYKKLGEEDVKILSIPIYSSRQVPRLDPDRVIYAADVAVCWLSREHFPWFEDGKYALLWDVSSSERKPWGLIKIKEANWENFIKERFVGCSRIAIPSCIIGCVSGENQTPSIILVRKEKKPIDNKEIDVSVIEERYRWEGNNLLNIFRDKRTDALDKTLFIDLKNEYNIKDDNNQFEEIKKYIKSIADDPNRGSILVFLNKTGINPFSAIGKPWKFNISKDEPLASMTFEDNIALMSHDGATIVKYDRERFMYEYRQLLTYEDLSNNIKDDLKDLALDVELEDEDKNIILDCLHPLSCVGTRRWSAALAAFRDEVIAVLVISQDGDIHYWKAAKNQGGDEGGLKNYNTEVYFLSNKKECIKYSYKYSKEKKKGKFEKEKL